VIHSQNADVRTLRPADAEGFRRLRLERLQDSPTAFGTSYEEELAKPIEELADQLEVVEADGSFVLGAFHGDELVGMVGVRRQPRLKHRHKVELWGMYVSPIWRGRGVGEVLLDQAIARARMIDGVRQMTLAVVRPNEAARSLYLKRGFVTFGLEAEALYWEGHYFAMEHMQLQLV
jgi:GNAT superfamily N-acetyltransferase